ncbi:MAG: HAMP domain-containing protein, partial [Elusimicrobiota bacterium]|nr:HAMP domain-containing protein [Elusimicrobiota bacterium]
MKISRVGIKFSAVVFLLILLVIFFLASMVLKQREKSFMKEMEIRTRFFGRTAQESLFPEKNPFQMHFAVHEMMKEKGILYAGVFDETGKFLSHSESARVGKKAGAGTDRKINALENFAVQQYKKDDQLYYKLILPLKVSDKKIGGVLIGFSKNSMGRALAAVREKIIKIALLVLSSGVILTMIIVRFMVKPIDNLAEAAGEIGEGNLDVRVKEKGKDEIGDLSRTFNEMVKGLGEREFLRETFGKYVNPEVARQALSKKLKLGGERKAVSVLLTDIRGFTRITEKIPPEKIVNLLNRYFNIIVDIVFDQDGTVDKFMGDAMLAVFGAPAYIENHPYKAAAAAWKIKQAVAK